MSFYDKTDFLNAEASFKNILKWANRGQGRVVQFHDYVNVTLCVVGGLVEPDVKFFVERGNFSLKNKRHFLLSRA